uniref:NAD(+) diphosphatase n=1 Tax=Moniliophthora roreri TaxID=221103 RepID=A0A0W0FVQ8_MONRR
MAKAKDRHINVYSGSPLNRLAWLRTSSGFLNAVITSPRSRWILFKAGQPLVHATPKSGPKIAYLPTSSVLPLLGSQPFFGQGEMPGHSPSLEHLTTHPHTLQAGRHRDVPVVFLGVHEKGVRVLPEKEVGVALKEGGEQAVEEFLNKDDSTPYFAIDVDDRDLKVGDSKDAVLARVLDDGVKELGLEEQVSLEWVDPRAAVSSMDHFEAGIFAEAQLDRGTLVLSGMWRPPLLYVGWLETRMLHTTSMEHKHHWQWAGLSFRVGGAHFEAKMTLMENHSSKGLHNYAHPRTDPVAIILTIDQTGERILLGRSRKFPPKLYSALAGFLEPAETFEDCVVREMWEEVGVKVWGIQYHSGQPWPYPANLMLGWYARGDSNKEIRLDLDNELEDAKWFTRGEILGILGHATGTKLDSKTFSEKMEEDQERALKDKKDQIPISPPVKGSDKGEPDFRIPPDSAMAGVLIRDWAEGRIKFDAEDV